MAAVQQNGCALKFADATLRAERKVVMAAVQQFGEALRFAPPDMQAEIYTLADDTNVSVQEYARMRSEPITFQVTAMKRSADGLRLHLSSLVGASFSVDVASGSNAELLRQVANHKRLNPAEIVVVRASGEIAFHGAPEIKRRRTW